MPVAGAVAGWGWNAWGQINPATCCNTKRFPVTGPSGPWSTVAAGDRVTVAARPDGTVWEWGQSDDSATCTLLCPPLEVPVVHNVLAVATSTEDLRLALDRAGTVWQWQSIRQRVPFAVAGLPPIDQIAAGNWYALALGRDGSVWQWSYSSDPSAAVHPIRIAGLPPARAIAAGFDHALAVTVDGDLWNWSRGSTVTTAPGAPAKVAGLAHVVAAAAGDRFSLALDAGGQVWSWGNNTYGDLGRGEVGPGSGTPTVILHGITAVAAQNFHAIALRSDGTVWTWGEDQNAEIGNGTVIPYGQQCGCVPRPTPVPGLTGVLAVSAGFFYDAVLLAPPLRSPPPRHLAACGPPPGAAPARAQPRVTLAIGEAPTSIATSDGLHRLYLLRPGRYDGSTDMYACTGSLLILDASRARTVASPLVGRSPVAVLTDDRADRLFVVDGGARDDALHGDVRIFSETSGRQLTVVHLLGAPIGAALAARAGHLFVTLADVPSTPRHDALVMLGTGTGRLIATLPLNPPEDAPVVDEATNRVFVHGGDGVIGVDASTGRQVSMVRQALCSGNLFDDPVDRRLITVVPGSSHNGEGSLCSLDPRTLRPGGTIDYGPNAGAGLDVVDGPAHLLVVQEAQYGIGPPIPYLTVLNARTLRIVRHVSNRFIPRAVDGTNGTLAALGARGEVEIVDPRGWRVLRRLRVPAPVIQLAIEQSPHRLIAVSGSGTAARVTVVDL